MISHPELKATDIQNSEMFQRGFTAYEWERLRDDDSKVYVMECDRYGKPMEEGRYTVFVRGESFWCSMVIPHEILDAPDLAEKMINNLRERYNPKYKTTLIKEGKVDIDLNNIITD